MLLFHALMEIVHPGKVSARAVFQEPVIPGYGVV
jgi:hypothetical protein